MRSGRSISVRLGALSLVAVLTNVVADSSSPPSKSATGTESRDTIVLERKAVIGRSPRVRQMLVEKSQGHQYHKALSELVIEERSAPPGCGDRTARLFRKEIVSTFQIRALDSCYISADEVDCKTDYLPGYSKVYLSLTYQRLPTLLDLSLTARQRGLWGTVDNVQLDRKHVAWFEGLFDCLVSVAECTDKPPPCARRAFPEELK